MGDDRGGASQTREHVLGAGEVAAVAVPKCDPQAAAGVHSLGKLARASVARQNKLL